LPLFLKAVPAIKLGCCGDVSGIFTDGDNIDLDNNGKTAGFFAEI